MSRPVGLINVSALVVNGFAIAFYLIYEYVLLWPNRGENAAGEPAPSNLSSGFFWIAIMVVDLLVFIAVNGTWTFLVVRSKSKKSWVLIIMAAMSWLLAFGLDVFMLRQ